MTKVHSRAHKTSRQVKTVNAEETKDAETRTIEAKAAGA